MSAEPKDEPPARDAPRDSEPQGRALVVPALPRIPTAPTSRPSGASRGGAEAVSGAPVSSRRPVSAGPVPIASESGLPALPLVDPASYAVETEIGRGGLARILRATDVRLGRPVALKVLRDTSRE